MPNTYFVAQFSKPFTSFGTFRQFPPRNGEKGEEGSILGSREVDPGQAKISGPFAGAYLDLTTTSGEQVLVKIAHGTSYEQAEQRLQSEAPGWDFDRVHRQAEDAWAAKLNQIEVEGGSEKEKTLFYSCLLHSFASPRLVAQKGRAVRDPRR